jgi:hypothetical protein
LSLSRKEFVVSLLNVVPPSSDKWKQLYQSAIFEPDYTRLPERISEARAAMLHRAEEILTHPSSDERDALHKALRILQILEEVALRKRRAA